MMEQYIKIINNWKSRMEIIGRNLIELDNEDFTKIIRNKIDNKDNPYTGQTMAKAENAIMLLDGLWVDYSLLQKVIENASEAASKNSIFHDTVNIVKELLEGKSLLLQVEHKPATERGLLEEADKEIRITPSEMLESMQIRFDNARSVISKIEEITESINIRLLAIRQQSDYIKNLSLNLGVNCEVFSMITRIEDDPIGCGKEIVLIEAKLLDYRKKLDLIRSEKDEVNGLINDINNMIIQLENLALKSKKAIEETLKKVLNPLNLIEPINKETINTLNVWIKNLEKNIHSGNFAASKVGLTKLKSECNLRIVIEENNYKSNRSSLDEIDDLKGKFSALCAKAEVYKTKKIITMNEFEIIKEDYKKILGNYPINLIKARESIGRIEKLLFRKYS